jgi:putative DNA-invertase from lambdoid prophage Rac
MEQVFYCTSVRHIGKRIIVVVRELLALEEFQSRGIDFISLNESIDRSTPMGRMVFTVFAAVAELERSLIRERVLMGLDRAKRQGKRLGRPRTLVDRERVSRLRKEGLSLRQIAMKLDVSKDKVARINASTKGV